jgi:uncharacterized protein YbjT (DUF2867 family)
LALGSYRDRLPDVFITGASGYLGRPLSRALVQRGFAVHALVRPGSEAKVADGAVPVIGNALDAASFAARIPAGSTLVHLVGTPHPSPAKAAEFRRVDLVSIQATVTAARTAGVGHLVYVSVAHPAPIMHAYIAVRREGEALVEATGIPATILRPWYVLGPGHWWPYALVPVYAILRRLPSTREAAHRLGLVTHGAMVAALVRAVEDPPSAGVRVIDVAGINRREAMPPAPR